MVPSMPSQSAPHTVEMLLRIKKHPLRQRAHDSASSTTMNIHPVFETIDLAVELCTDKVACPSGIDMFLETFLQCFQVCFL